MRQTAVDVVDDLIEITNVGTTVSLWGYEFGVSAPSLVEDNTAEGRPPYPQGAQPMHGLLHVTFTTAASEAVDDDDYRVALAVVRGVLWAAVCSSADGPVDSDNAWEEVG